MKAIFAVVGVGLVSLLGGCASAPLPSASVATVGPNPESPRTSSPQGSLEVFSRFSQRNDDQNEATTDPTWFQHTDYFLCDTQGRVLKQVYNVAGHFEKNPRLVDLAPGKYVVEAESARNYWVQVPVMIKRGQTTSVHLDGTWAPPSYVDKAQVVTLPDGKPVGWRM